MPGGHVSLLLRLVAGECHEPITGFEGFQNGGRSIVIPIHSKAE